MLTIFWQNPHFRIKENSDMNIVQLRSSYTLNLVCYCQVRSKSGSGYSSNLFLQSFTLKQDNLSSVFNPYLVFIRMTTFTHMALSCACFLSNSLLIFLLISCLIFNLISLELLSIALLTLSFSFYILLTSPSPSPSPKSQPQIQKGKGDTTTPPPTFKHEGGLKDSKTKSDFQN